jgi:hypothetical protein
MTKVKTGNKGEKKTRKNLERITNPPESALVYRGPLSLPRQNQERHTTTVWMTYGPNNLQATVGGVINTVVSNDPTGYNDWSSVSAVWDEYRVLGMKMIYYPYNKYNEPTSTVVGPVFLVLDRDDGVAVASEALAINYESVKMKGLNEKWTFEGKMAGVTEATYITTASPVANMWIKTRADGVTISHSYGRYYIAALVQFRGRN